MSKQKVKLVSARTNQSISVMIDMDLAESCGFAYDRVASVYTRDRISRFATDNYPVYISRVYFDFGDIECVYDDTWDDTGRFKTGYRVYKDDVNYYVQFMTNIQGLRKMVWSIPKTDYDSVQKLIDPTESSSHRPIWIGLTIY